MGTALTSASCGAAHSEQVLQIIGTVSNAFNALVETAYTTLPPSNAYYAYNNLEDPWMLLLEASALPLLTVDGGHQDRAKL